MSAVRRPTQLLDLPDELLSEVLQHVSVADKQQNVQLCCMRLRRLLMQPIARRTWGSVRVRVQQAEPVTATQLGALLQWLTSRQAGSCRHSAMTTGCGVTAGRIIPSM